MTAISYDNEKEAHEIGAYGTTFFERSSFLYKTKTHCEGYFIRKSNWFTILYTNM
jgi:hypothetical protein